MKKENKILFFVFLYITIGLTLFTTSCFATKLVQTFSPMNALTIEAPSFEIVPRASNFTFYWHLYNESGTKLTNSTASCIFHLYRNTDGTHIIQQNGGMDSNSIDWKVTINNSVLATGQYYNLIHCNTSTIGGFSLYEFEAGDITIDRTNSLSIIIAIIFFIGFMIFWAYSLEPEHALLKLGLIIIVFITLQLLPAVLMKTTSISTVFTFYKIWTYFYRFVITYLMIYLVYAGAKATLIRKGWIRQSQKKG